MYRVAIKLSDPTHNDGLRAAVETGGSMREFASRAAAESFSDELCTKGGPVRLQRPAPQDPADVDAYLVKDAQADEWTPIEENGQRARFRTGANVYGSIGLGIVYLDGTPSPALRHYFQDQAPAALRGEVRNVALEPTLPDPLDEELTWQPDLRVDVATRKRDGTDPYFAEVKSGGASFERNQRADMQRVARDHGVLKLRVDLADLPAEYTVRVHQVTPETWPGGPR